jgi:dynein heavy chain, axonemal
LDDYELQLKKFSSTEDELELINGTRIIGALSLNTATLKAQLAGECGLWKTKYCQKLHQQARDSLEGLAEYMRVATVSAATTITTDCWYHH